jgi:hypothetical protein
MKAQDKKAIIQELSPLVPLVVGGAIKMIATPTVGYVVLGLVAEFYWFYALQKNWAWVQPIRQSRRWQIIGYVVIAVIFGGLAIYAHFRPDKPISPSMAVRNENSPGAIAVGENKGSITVVQTDPNAIVGINEKLDALLAIRDADVIARLNRDYDCGFVLVAFSDEVDATRARPYTARGVIQADWDKCKAQKQGDCITVSIPNCKMIGDGVVFKVCSEIRLSFPIDPRKESSGLIVGDITVKGEYLRTDPWGHCFVLGFKRLSTLIR